MTHPTDSKCRKAYESTVRAGGKWEEGLLLRARDGCYNDLEVEIAWHDWITAWNARGDEESKEAKRYADANMAVGLTDIPLREFAKGIRSRQEPGKEDA